MEWNANNGGRENQLDSGQNLKAELTEFANGLDGVHDRMREVKKTEVLNSSNQVHISAIY